MMNPIPCSYDDFPESTAFTEGIIVIPADLGQRSCKIEIDVTYAVKNESPLHLHIIEPSQGEEEHKLFPLILYVQGSAWREQNTGYELSQLARFARRGYVIAVVEYRPSSIAPFPAQIKDTKTAMRYMINNAMTYHADPSNIFLWGDSSGGHTALMTGFTLDNPDMEDETYKDEPLSVKAIIDYYGPTDISKMNDEPSIMNHILQDSPEGELIGGVNVLENMDRVKATVVMNYITEQHEIPPVIIIHGSKDRFVPFGQSVMLYHKLRQKGKEALCYQLKGADHGGSAFWTEEIFDIIEKFIQCSIK